MPIRERLLAMGVLAAALTACDRGEVYPMSVGRVEHRLRDMVMPAELGLNSYGNDVVVEEASGRAVTWRVMSHGTTVGWVDAKLSPIDLDHTRVAVAFRAADVVSDGGEAQKNLMAAVGTAVIGEAVDAELDGRPYNRSRAQAQIAAYALTHRSELADVDLDDHGSSDADRQSVIAEASARDPRLGVEIKEEDTQRRMEAASAPALDLDHRRR